MVCYISLYSKTKVNISEKKGYSYYSGRSYLQIITCSNIPPASYKITSWHLITHLTTPLVIAVNKAGILGLHYRNNSMRRWPLL